MISDVSTRATEGGSYDAYLTTAESTTRLPRLLMRRLGSPTGAAGCSTKATASCQSLAPSAANFSKKMWPPPTSSSILARREALDDALAAGKIWGKRYTDKSQSARPRAGVPANLHYR